MDAPVPFDDTPAWTPDEFAAATAPDGSDEFSAKPYQFDVDAILQGMNERQLQAVTAPHESMLILAGAGSGKTRVLTSRIAYLIANEMGSSRSIMAVTFTNKASREMKERLEALTGIDPRSMWIGTFHGICNRMLKENAEIAGLPSGFQIMDEDDQLALIKRVFKGLRGDSPVKEGEETEEKETIPYGEIQSAINRCKEQGARAADPLTGETLVPGFTGFCELYAAYERQCDQEGVVDFAELMLRTIEILRNPEVRDKYQGRFNNILIDEFQDTSPQQYEWLEAIHSPRCAVMAVGDDDQSIYGFRGAEPANIRNFLHKFASDRLIKLEQNYRSTSIILNAANAVIEKNASRLGKNLWTESTSGKLIDVHLSDSDLEEAYQVARSIRGLVDRGIKPGEIAILYRSNAQSRVLEKSLLGLGVPYSIYGGQKFFERQEVKHAVAYMRMCMNIADNGATLRVINMPPRGLGGKSIEKLQETAKARHRENLLLATFAAADGGDQKAAPFALIVLDLLNAMEKLTLPAFMDYMLKRTGLLNHYQSSSKPEEKERALNLIELINAAKQFGSEDRKAYELLDEFLCGASLESAADRASNKQTSTTPDKGKVNLMTIHASKGLEFDHVFVTGLEEGLMPHSMSTQTGELAVEEERRLMYVAITRARNQLNLYHAMERMQYGEKKMCMPSRFITEIPGQYLNMHYDPEEMAERRQEISKRQAVVNKKWPFKSGQSKPAAATPQYAPKPKFAAR